MSEGNTPIEEIFTPSELNGDLVISKREDESGGDLTVEGNIICDGLLSGNFPLKPNGGIVSDQSDGSLQIEAESVKTIIGFETTLTTNSDLKFPSSKAVATYVTDRLGTLTLGDIHANPTTVFTLAALPNGETYQLPTILKVNELIATALGRITVSSDKIIDLIYDASDIDTGAGYAVSDYAVSEYVYDKINALKLEVASKSHQHTVTPFYDVPVSGLITLERDKASYVKTITGNTVVGFDVTELGLGANDSATFELLLKMETYVYSVLFGNNIAWLNGEEPYFTEPNKSYLFAFRTYDGGNSWVGAYQGAF